jgi:hypothetical protein
MDARNTGAELDTELGVTAWTTAERAGCLAGGCYSPRCVCSRSDSCCLAPMS